MSDTTQPQLDLVLKLPRAGLRPELTAGKAAL
jgi:hypothetical protein